MSTVNQTHQGLERMIAGFEAVASVLTRSYRDGAVQLFLVIGMATAAAATATALIVAPIEGTVVFEWIGVWTLVVLSVLAVTRIAAGVGRWAPGAYTRSTERYVDGWREARLEELMRSDYRVAQELRAIRSRDQSDH